MGKTRNTGKLATQIQFDNSNNLVIGTSASSSFNTSGSVNAIGGITGSIFGIGNPTSFSASISSNLVSIQSVTASNIARLSNLETKSSSVDISVSSINTFTSSNSNTSLNLLTSSLATTGSNSFYGTQVFSGSVYIANDLIVQGSSSIQYISASSVSIGTNIVQLNTANPSVRFAGLTMIDSGSVGGSGSFLYDSIQDEFIFVHRGNGTNITSSHFVTGPETYDNLGNELYLTCNIITKGTGKEHLVDSCIFDNGTTTCIKNNLIGTGTIIGTTTYSSTISCSPSFIGGTMSGTTIYGSTAVCSAVGKFTTCIDAGSGTFSSSVTAAGGTTITSANAQTTLNLNNTNACATIASAIYFNKNGTPKWGIGTDVYSNTGANEIQIYDFTNDLIRAKFTTSGANIIGTLGVTCAATFSSTIAGTTIYGSTAVCSPVGKFTSCIDAGTGTFTGGITATSLGIGLTASAKIQAEVGNTTSIGLFSASGLAITSGGGSTGNIYQIAFGYGGGTYGSSALYGLTESSTGYNTGALVFATRTLTTDTAPIERMRITSGGNVVFNGGDANGWYVGFSNSSTNFAYMGATTQFANSGGSSTDFGIRAANSLAFYTSGGNERMRITCGGNVGIGTCNPTAIGGYGGLTLDGTDGSFIDLRLNGSNNGRLYGSSTTALGMESLSTTLPLVFKTQNGSGSTERMRITPGGEVLIGITTTSLANSGTQFVNNGETYHSIINSLNTLHVYDRTNSVYRFYVSGGGTVNASSNTISVISDVRLKENIVDLEIGLDAIMALRPRKFDWKKESGNSGKNVRGFIAQEFEEIFPDLIDESINPAPEGEEPYKQIRQDLIPILVKAIQEQQCTINLLKSCAGIV